MIENPINIVIADDNRFFCDALKDSLNQHEEFSISHTFTSINSLINFTTNHSFDVLILDVNFNSNNSLDFISKIRPNISDFKIIVLTTMNNNYIKSKALDNGINLVLGKDGDLDNFKNHILNCYHENKQLECVQQRKITIDNYTFTKRKLDVLQALYIHSDKNEKELSKALHISESALKSHKRDLFEISNTKNTPDLIKFGIKNGLILS